MILALGAGTYQSELIKIAKEFGEVTALSYLHSDVGFAHADNKETISILDFEGCLSYAEEKHCSAIVSSGSQLAAYTQARLNDRLKLNGFPFDFVRTMTNKLSLREWLKKEGFSKVRFTTDKDLISSSESWVIKPRIASGSKGIEKYSNLSNLDAIADTSFFVKGWLAEEFIEGESGSTLFIINEGRAKRLLSTRKVINSSFVPVAHALYDYRTSENDFLQSIVEQMVTEFELKSGFIDLDFLLTETGLEVVDVGTRLSGNGLTELYNLLSKENLYREQVKMSLDLPLNDLQCIESENIGLMLFYSDDTGVLKSFKSDFENLEILKRKEFVNPGADVLPLTEGKNQLGFFIFRTDENSYQKLNALTKESNIVLE